MKEEPWTMNTDGGRLSYPNVLELHCLHEWNPSDHEEIEEHLNRLCPLLAMGCGFVDGLVFHVYLN